MSSDAVTLPSTAPEPTGGLTITAPGASPGSRAVRDGLDITVTRAGVIFRGSWCVVIPLLVFVVGPAVTVPRVVAVAAVVGWGITVWLTCRHRRTPPVWLVLADASLSAALLLAMTALLPGPLDRASGGWVSGSATVSILLAAWRLSAPLAAAVTAVEMGAYVGGLRLGGVPWSPMPPSNVLTYGVQLVIALMVIGLMRRSARSADATLDRLEAAHRQSAVGEARLKDRRARQLALHDTVLATLVAVARGGLVGRADLVRRRCRADLDSLAVLSTAWSDDGVPLERFLARLNAQAERCGLSVQVTSRSPHLVLRAEVAAAMADAAREALSNVERYAGVRAVRIMVEGGEDRVEVTVADSGVGFDPLRVRAGATGLAQSITGRMEDVGGSATVVTSPGNGTAMTLRWSAGPPRGEGEFMQRLRRLLAGAYVGGVSKAVVAVALPWHLYSLSMLLANWHAYRAAPVVLAAWIAILVVGVVLTVRVVTRGADGVDGRLAATTTAVLVAATLAVIASCSLPGLLNQANWITGDLGWFIAILAVYRAGWEAAVPLGVLASADVAAVVLSGGRLSDVVAMIGILFSIAVLQVGAIVVFRILKRNADLAALAVRRINDLEVERAAQTAIMRDRAARDRKLDRDLLPLVRGLADERLDPEDPTTRQRCDVAAGVLRAMITHDGATTSTAALDAVAAMSEAARINEVVPDPHIGPDFEEIPEPVRERLLAILTATLALGNPGEANLTIGGSTVQATATVCLPTSRSCEELRRDAAAAAAELVAAVGGNAVADTERVDEDRVWLQIEWEIPL
jgi:signal transduction histidine kinase